MRKRYVQINGELVEVSKDWRPEPKADFHVMPDIQPYQSMVDGTMITSRSHHRAHLKQHGMIEVGNEVKHLKAYGPKPPPGLKDALIRVVNEKWRR